MIYVAVPYRHKLKSVEEQRYETATAYAAELISEGHFCYSPITHGHPLHKLKELPQDWEFWEVYDKIFFDICTELHVLTITGWDKSVGVQAEIQWAQESNKPISYIFKELPCSPI